MSRRFRVNGSDAVALGWYVVALREPAPAQRRGHTPGSSLALVTFGLFAFIRGQILYVSFVLTRRCPCTLFHLILLIAQNKVEQGTRTPRSYAPQ
jgi:predicted membrane channel-forming protein YqfA (hemolysin III family)